MLCPLSHACVQDGAVPHESWSVEVAAPPIVRTLLSIPIPSLSSNLRGVFFVEVSGEFGGLLAACHVCV